MDVFLRWLLVLDRPDIPLHNNTAENAIREYVKRRKISGSIRSEASRKCRDTFTSLKKTCRKLGVSFWQYLQDRLEHTARISSTFRFYSAAGAEIRINISLLSFPISSLEIHW